MLTRMWLVHGQMLKINTCWYKMLNPSFVSYLIRNGTHVRKGKRKVQMRLFGSTLGASKYPRFSKNGGEDFHMIPRPFSNSRPGKKGYLALKEKWFIELVKEINNIAMCYIIEESKKHTWARKVLTDIKDSLKLVPDCCRICSSCFTMMSINGDQFSSKDGISAHFDKQDSFNVLLHVGNVKEGGSTRFYSGSSESDMGKMIMEIPFHHGYMQMGCFKDILHGTSGWKGDRCSINFAIKPLILNHFRKEGLKYYQHVIEANYDCKGLLIVNDKRVYNV